MKTTINIDDDVLDQARAVASKLDVPFRRVVNDALRAGLQKVEISQERKAYKAPTFNMGLKEGINLDNIQEVIAQYEGEDYR